MINRRHSLLALLLAPFASRVQAAPTSNAEWLIMPSIRHCEVRTKTRHENCWTLHYVWMDRVNPAMTIWETTHVNTRRYREWLNETPPKGGIPPHIAFGGAIVAGEHDPTFHDRWVKYARDTFAA